MKKYFLLALVVLTGIASSCKYDDDELWDNVNDLADRITALETVTKQMNSDIAAMQSVITALQKQLTVTKVEELTDGYTLHFSDGTKATLKNGTDGKDGVNAPSINVAQYNGSYYWTIAIDGNTTWLTDDAGNKLAVSGTSGSNGTDGKTPMLKVDEYGYWLVSYDGSKFERVKNTKGEDVKAKASDAAADYFFEKIEIGESGDVVITMKGGQEYNLPVAAPVTYRDKDGKEVGKVTLNAGKDVTLSYEIKLENVSVEIVKTTEGISASVDESRKTLNIKAATTAAKAMYKVVILYYNANQTITSVLNVEVN